MSLWYALCDALGAEFLSMNFMKNALLAVIVMAPLFGLLSTMIVTGKMSFFSDALGHSGFTGIAIGVLCGAALPVWWAVGLAVAFALILSPAFNWMEGTWGAGVAAAAAFLPAIAALVVATVLERIKRENDLVTYREILAFMNGEANIERDPRALPRRAWPTKHRLAYDLLTFIAAAAIGGALGFAVWGLLN